MGPPFTCRLSVVNDGDEPVPIAPDVKDHVTVHSISVLERAANIIEIVPANRLDDGDPGFDFVRRIRVVSHCLTQMLTHNDMHPIRRAEILKRPPLAGILGFTVSRYFTAR